MKRMLMINAAIAAGLAAAFVIAPGQAAPSGPIAQTAPAKSELSGTSRPAYFDQVQNERRPVRVVYPSPFAR